MDPGPTDISVLGLQHSHRSSSILSEGAGLLTTRHHLDSLISGFVFDDRVLAYVRRVGFYAVHRLRLTVQLDRALITTLVERWRQETHTFHLSLGEATVTLKDVAILMGLRVHGPAVTGTAAHSWADVVEELLGIRPTHPDLRGGSIRSRWLRQHFARLPENADDVTIERFARAYLLILIGGVLFADKTGNEIQLIYLPLLRDWDRAARYSWGSATLAYLYRHLCRACDHRAKEIAGPLILLQLWSWEHIAIGRPTIASSQAPILKPDDPLGCKWLRADLSHVDYTGSLTAYRDFFDHQTPDQMIWDPYPLDVLDRLPEICCEHQHIWRTRSPLICFDIIEWYFPDRVFRQFGMMQVIPPPCDTRIDLHKLDRRGRHTQDWEAHHQAFIAMWNAREGEYEGVKSIQEGTPSVAPMATDDPYMLWYRRITRRYITPSIGRIASEPLVDELVSLYTMMLGLRSCVDDETRLSLENGLAGIVSALTRAGALKVVQSLPPLSSQPSSSSQYSTLCHQFVGRRRQRSPSPSTSRSPIAFSPESSTPSSPTDTSNPSPHTP